MGEVRDSWLRTDAANNDGKIRFRPSDAGSVTKASETSWSLGAVVVHMFNRVYWYDARVAVGTRDTDRFGTITVEILSVLAPLMINNVIVNYAR